MKSFEFKGKIALITGANRGIGEAYVHVLLQAGVKKVYAAARNLDNLKSLQKQYPDTLEAVLLDVTHREHINALKDQIPSLDILVNNAGIANACSFTAENALDIAREEMEVNYFAPLQITQAVLPQLKQSAEALIVNISSIAGISNFPNAAPYSASKAAVHSLTQGLRTELAHDDIQIVGVYPGPIDTRMAEGFDMDKPVPEQVVYETIAALSKQEYDVFPDDFSNQMYGIFLEHPKQLEKLLADMMGG